MSACSSRTQWLRWSVVLTLTAPVALAQWTQLANPQVPSARTEASLVWLDHAHTAVLFGGRDSNNNQLAETWLHDGFGFRRLTPGPSPGAHSNAAAAYDSQRQRLVLFGGVNSSNNAGNDTWAFDGVRWTQLNPATRPPARMGAAMAYDARRDRMVLVGGSTGGVPFGDTWEFDGAQWTQVNSPSQPVLAFASCVYDALRAQTLVFGGTDGINEHNDLWAFDGVDWRLLATNPVPAARQRAVVAYDGDRGVMTLTGGEGMGTALGDTWEFDGVAWTQLTGNGPSARSGAAMTFDRDHMRCLMHGGSTGGNQTWVLHNNPRAYAAWFGPSCDGRSLERQGDSLPEIGDTFRLDLQGTGPASLVLGVMGSSATSSGGLPLPRPLPVPNVACQQLIDIGFPSLLASNGGLAAWALSIPNNAALVGYQGFLQGFELEPSAGGLVVHTSNAIEYRIGKAPLQRRVVEDFTSSQQRDVATSAGLWAFGRLAAGVLGGDGRLGSFDPTLGTLVSANVYEFSTDNMSFPAGSTLTGDVETVTDGRFFFTDLVVPAGITIRFTGSAPAQLFVRGRAEVLGRVELNGAGMTTFDCRAPQQATVIPGQPGGLGGPGAGRGGKGGDRCLGLGYQPAYDGQAGEDVQLPAGHAYASRAVGTGGQGSPVYPPSCGMAPASVVATFLNIYTGQCAPGGGGGGFWVAGQPGYTNNTLPAVRAGTAPAGGGAFNNFPVPGSAASLDHFLVGGSGGGGGGSHPFYALAITGFLDIWKAGAGGSGGGGALAIRAGGDVVLGSSGLIEAHGGNGTNFADRGAAANRVGNACPGGGGSGGSVLLQTGGALDVLGSINTAGGTGSTIANVVPANAAIPGTVVRGGDGSAGTYRLESLQSSNINPLVLVPTLDPVRHVGTLLDRDATSGSRSLFVALPSANANVTRCERYEIDADVNGVPVRFSDDPAFGIPADGPLGPVWAHFQAGRLSGATVVASGPWRTHFGAATGDDLNRDLPTHARFDLVLNGNAGPVTVRAVRLYCR